MTSRETVRAVLAHEIPDYIPNGLGGCETAGLHVLAYKNLQQAMEMESNPPRINTFMTNAVFEEDMIRTIKGDIILIASPRMCKSPLRGKRPLEGWKEQQIWQNKFLVGNEEQFEIKNDGTVVWTTAGNIVCPPGSYFFDHLGATDLFEELNFISPKDFNPPNELPDDILRDLEETAKRLYEETSLSLCLGETIMDLQVQPAGLIGTMVMMIEEPETIKEFLGKSAEAALSQLVGLNQAVGKYVDILSIAHDFGDNRGVTMGAELWRNIYKPFYKQLFRGWQETTDMKVNLHSCGAISEILPDLIECGVQIINPVQTSAHGMSAESLKKDFGDKVIFWGGGYDSQLFSQDDSYENVFNKTCEVIETFKPGGGYIFSGVHNLPADISSVHLKAILDAWNNVKEY